MMDGRAALRRVFGGIGFALITRAPMHFRHRGRISRSFFVATVALLSSACHRDTRERQDTSDTSDKTDSSALRSTAEPALAEVVNAATLEIADAPPGDETEGVHQEQLELADELRSRLDALEAAARATAANGFSSDRRSAPSARAPSTPHRAPSR
jgi:hypothetical protein